MDKFGYLKALRGTPITPAEYRLLVTLLDYSDHNLTNAYPSYSTLADDTRSDRSVVIDRAKKLESLGYLEGKRRARQPTIWTLRLPDEDAP